MAVVATHMLVRGLALPQSNVYEQLDFFGASFSLACQHVGR